MPPRNPSLTDVVSYKNSKWRRHREADRAPPFDRAKPEASGYLSHIVPAPPTEDLGNEREIFAALRTQVGRRPHRHRGHSGGAPNFFHGQHEAQFGRAPSRIRRISADREQRLRPLLETMESTVLTDVKLTFEGVQTAESYPQRLPDLFLRQTILLYGRISRPKQGRVCATARVGDNPYECKFGLRRLDCKFTIPDHKRLGAKRVEKTSWTRASQRRLQTRDSSTRSRTQFRYRSSRGLPRLLPVEEVVQTRSGRVPATVPVPTELTAGCNWTEVLRA